MSIRYEHEVRDPIYAFIRFDRNERRLIDSRPFQRLRHIHQLALSYLVYPGATHKRFEHSLGVMELASRVYEVITHEDNIRDDSIRRLIPRNLDYWHWLHTLRAAALCHDMGHLPFSHAAEDELLPEHWNHERLTVRLINDPELEPIWKDLHLDPDEVAKLAVGPRKHPGPFTEWEAILSEVITGDAFGVDRMDYLLRDSHHTGVAYGRFDHYRLIDTLRVLPMSVGESNEPVLGLEIGGLQSGEALLLARYFIFSQVYFHPVRRIYDIHLKEFLLEFLEGGQFPVDSGGHLAMTDNEVLAAINHAADDAKASEHDAARRICNRQHYRLVYEAKPEHIRENPAAGAAVAEALGTHFGSPELVRHDEYAQESQQLDFPVLQRDETIESALELSKVLPTIPTITVDYVFVDPAVRDDAEEYLTRTIGDIIAVE